MTEFELVKVRNWAIVHVCDFCCYLKCSLCSMHSFPKQRLVIKPSSWVDEVLVLTNPGLDRTRSRPGSQIGSWIWPMIASQIRSQKKIYLPQNRNHFFFVSSLVRVLVVLRNWCNNNKLVNLVFSTMSLQLRFTKARVNRCSEYNQPFEYKRWSY